MIGPIGILGVGHLAGYLVAGLRRHADAPEVLLSPRNAERSARLAETAGVSVAVDNARLVRNCPIVLLATRPGQAVEAVRGLPWHDGQVLVSLCAGLARAALTPHCAPALLVRAMPITAAKLGESPTCLYPDHKIARQVFEKIGIVLTLPDESSFEVASVSAAYYGWIHALIGEVRDWTIAAGLPPEVAGPLVAQTTRAAASMVAAAPERATADLVEELATPGGITEAGLDTLRCRDSLADWRAACAAALAKMTKR